MIKLTIILLSVLATVAAQISLKKGMLIHGAIRSADTLRLNELFGNVYIWIGGSSYIFAFALYLVLLSRFELSRIYPVTTGLAFVSVVLISNNVFRELVSIDKIVGIAFILVGITLLTYRL